MREEVLVLPPSEEGSSKASFHLGRTDEAIFNTSRNCTAPELIYVKRSAHVASIRRDWKAEEGKVNAAESPSEEKVESGLLRGKDHSTAPPLGLERHERVNGEVNGKQETLDSLSLHQTQQDLLQGAPPLQWGSLKRSRCSRRPNNQPKPRDVVDECKIMQVSAVKDSSVMLISSAVASEENLSFDLKNAILRRRDRPYSPSAIAIEDADLDEDCKKEKRLRISPSMEGRTVVSVQAGKRGSLQASQQACQQREYLPITRSSLGRRVTLPDNYPAALTDGLKASRAGNDFSLSKFVLSLSRKEVEEDFLMFKGSKPTKRPRHRPRVAEKAVLGCTPGIWLSDVSYARYIVKEKKCLKENPRGLKAMQSLDFDSE